MKIIGKGFAGDKKVGKSLLFRYENRLKQWCIPRIPSYIETYHLTLLTLVWSVGVLVFSYLARDNFLWLWLVSLMIIFQYLSDLLDGELGRQRNTGLIRWGYYMDHYLDYVFLCSMLIGYSFIIPANSTNLYFFVLVVLIAFMVNSFLSFGASNTFRISYFGVGPTELRAVFILLNILLAVFGTTYIAFMLPWVLIASWIALQVLVYRTQKELWQVDMKIKKESERSEHIDS